MYAYYRCSNNCPNSSIKVEDLEKVLILLLKEITPTKECLDLFIEFLYKTYNERFSRLMKIKEGADDEIVRLKATREILIQKNLSGIYSDEIFKEQNSIIEDKIMKAQIVKEDSVLDKYNIEALTTFIKTLLADLGETYKRSNISQIRVLLGSIFLFEIAWDYNGTLNHRISPIYQSIRYMDKHPISFGTPDRIRTGDLLDENQIS
jgi:hypothetical protein